MGQQRLLVDHLETNAGHEELLAMLAILIKPRKVHFLAFQGSEFESEMILAVA